MATPDVVFALTTEFISPSVLLALLSASFQFQDTNVPLPLFTSELLPSVKPSVPKAVNISVLLSCALLLFETICLYFLSTVGILFDFLQVAIRLLVSRVLILSWLSSANYWTIVI